LISSYSLLLHGDALGPNAHLSPARTLSRVCHDRAAKDARQVIIIELIGDWTMGEPLFDPAYVPADVVSRDRVGEVNALVERLRSRVVDRIEMPEPGSRFQVSNMARVYSQAHLRRCLQFIEGAHQLVYTGYGLAAVTMVRAIYETVANYVAVSQRFVELIEADSPLQEIHDFIHTRTFAARSEGLAKIAGTDEVKATNILTQVRKMNRLRGDFEREYEYLCEHTHPNAFGAILYFIDPARQRDVHVFASRGHAPKEDLKWVLVGAHILTHFADAMDRLDAALPSLSERGRLEAPAKPDVSR
jgi:hypothetical protein